MGIIWVVPRVGLCGNSVAVCKGITSAHNDMREGSNCGPLEAHQTSPGCGILVLAPSHTTVGENPVCTQETVAERASNTEIFLAKSPLNLG